jgi:hypothetical protein
MNIDDLTIRQAKELAALFPTSATQPEVKKSGGLPPAPVIVCTDKRAVVFGYTSDADARPIVLTNARMCLYWSADVGGVFGLGEVGPTADCKISATLATVTLEGVAAIFSVDEFAEAAWRSAEVQGR